MKGQDFVPAINPKTFCIIPCSAMHYGEQSNNAIGENFEGEVDNSVFPIDFEIDHVRVDQKEPS